MKKIINGRLYNTETAQIITDYSNGLCCNDFRWIEETLYRKRNGEFFLHGEGGPMTKYAKQIDTNSWCSGEAISPLSDAEAREWMEQCADADTYIRCFGDVEE